MPRSVNLNYIYNVEYYNTFFAEGNVNDYNLSIFKSKLVAFPQDEWGNIPGFSSFTLMTSYPGLLMGVGGLHEVKDPENIEKEVDDFIKMGFSFDFVTGNPYLPGSSLKGILRSYFPKGNNDSDRETIIKTLLGVDKDEDFNVIEFGKTIFGTKKRENNCSSNAVFLGAYPTDRKSEKKIVIPIAEDYITPHPMNQFDEPNPIKIIKVAPGVKFDFCFALQDFQYQSSDNNTRIIPVAKILSLFESLVKLYGVGAKTNVGYGRFR